MVHASNSTPGTNKNNICGKVKKQDLVKSKMTEEKIWISNLNHMEHKDDPNMEKKLHIKSSKRLEKEDQLLPKSFITSNKEMYKLKLKHKLNE